MQAGLNFKYELKILNDLRVKKEFVYVLTK